MSSHDCFPPLISREYDVPGDGQRHSSVIPASKMGAEQRNIKRCDACDGAPGGCDVCRGTGIELWVLPPLQREAPRFVVLSWIGLFLVGALFWAGIAWAVVAWRNAL